MEISIVGIEFKKSRKLYVKNNILKLVIATLRNSNQGQMANSAPKYE